MLKNLLRGIVALPLILLVLVFATVPAAAADLRKGDTIIIASGDVINDDLYAAGNSIIINGTVNGDVLLAGDTITLNGKINGNVMAIGSTVKIDGEVTHAVRVAGSSINISGNIGGDLVAAGDELEIAGDTKISRDLVFAARNTNINSFIGNKIKGLGSNVNLRNGTGGDVELGTEQLIIGSTANIQGNLVYTSQNEAVIQPGAQIGGTTTHNIPEARKPVFPSMGILGSVIAFLMTLLTGIIIVLVVPKRASAVAVSLKRKPLLSLGWGAIILCATPVAALITFITVIGIPVGLIGLVIYGIAIYLSQVAVGLFIGHWILGNFYKVDSRGILVGAMALGFAILTVIKLIPYIGIPLWIATALFGIGAMALSQKTMRSEATAEMADTSGS